MRVGLLFADILIVDPTPELGQEIRPALQAAGYSLRRVGSGQEAWEAVRSTPPDLLLVEAVLPDVDGRELVRQLKTATDLPFIPVIMMKAQHTSWEAAALLDAGADEFIARPVDKVELLTRVRAMLRLKSTTDELAELSATLEQKVVERTRQLEEAQRRLRHAEKLSALGRMAASIAHEINNPLTAIVGYLYLTKRELAADAPVRENLDIVEREVNVIARLVQGLRDFSKPPARERRPVDLNGVLEDVLLLMGKELRHSRIEVFKNLDPDLPMVLASPDQMREIFLNLVLNARDAMLDGGQLTLSTAVCGGQVQVQVSDSGVGIKGEHLQRIFEPFFTTKGESGTGLGLAICHSIVEDHQGEIAVDSQPGKGTVFTLRFPLA